MPYCATNKFASTKRKLPRDLVISSEAQASAEVAMYGRIRLQRFSSSTILLTLGLASLLLAGCNSSTCVPGTPGCKTVFLMSIQVSPANPSVTEGSQQQFTATGTFSDASTQDLTKTVRWSSSDNSIVTIDSAGLASTHSLVRRQITPSADTVVGTAAMATGSTHLIQMPSSGIS